MYGHTIVKYLVVSSPRSVTYCSLKDVINSSRSNWVQGEKVVRLLPAIKWKVFVRKWWNFVSVVQKDSSVQPFEIRGVACAKKKL
jgi:hypothetical protein